MKLIKPVNYVSGSYSPKIKKENDVKSKRKMASLKQFH